MIIQKIEIQNFRSYYGKNSFELVNGLNLIIGSNGDGKTTFYEALEWLFKTDGTKQMDTKYISKKRIYELDSNQSDDVRVAMTYEHNGMKKTLEKMFHFTKSIDENEISTSNYTFYLKEDNGIERPSFEGSRFDSDFPSDVRKYTMFKGESNLDVFQESTALKMLIETFSDVKDFEAYFSFMQSAIEKAELARDKAQKLDKKNGDKIKSLKQTIEHERSILYDIDKEIVQKENEATNFDEMIKNIEHSKESSEMLKAVNRRIDTLTEKRRQIQNRIKEEYTSYMLDESWVLMGFAKIAEEFSSMINKADHERRRLNNDYMATMGAERMLKKIQKDFTPLPVHIPGKKIMEEMLNEEVCKICGRRAEKHSEAWEYMLQRLKDYEASLNVISNEEIEPLFKNDYIVEMQKRDTTLNDNMEELTKLRHTIQEWIALNNRLHEDVKKIEINITKELEQKKRILAQVDGLSEEQLLANYESISNWMEKRGDAQNRVNDLKRDRTNHQQKLLDAQNQLNQLAEGTTAETSARAAIVIQDIAKAFNSAKETNKKRLLHSIEDYANLYLGKLNINDFKGVIRIIEKANGQGEAVLRNSDGTRIFNPNTALRTTYLMSVLFAISKLSSEKENSAYPLLFDAPTSSFTETKESEFFNVISSLNKQVIIVTKSFLKENDKGELVHDQKKIESINGKVFRIEKKRPFDDKRLETIQTVITKIK